ncbi:Neuropeptide CCHamide-1 receptor [Eumeta japonica]|uniref:Neuropeptide CCHamide-1 receptor n=1 Tax=Eumeta variegata TaxID=151549 RepID=A0A4C1X968_EUMVA|nr:Neuropeptide CCHamide-1 receptor [Eumeta japonica]
MAELNVSLFTNKSEPYQPYIERPETYIVPIIFAIIFVVGVVGNGTLVVVFVRHKAMRNVPNTPSHIWSTSGLAQPLFLNRITAERLESSTLRRDVASSCMFYRIYHGECSEEQLKLILAAEFRHRSTCQKYHHYHLHGWRSITVVTMLNGKFSAKGGKTLYDLPSKLFPINYDRGCRRFLCVMKSEMRKSIGEANNRHSSQNHQAAMGRQTTSFTSGYRFAAEEERFPSGDQTRRFGAGLPPLDRRFG